jgi:hypothetical protein
MQISMPMTIFLLTKRTGWIEMNWVMRFRLKTANGVRRLMARTRDCGSLNASSILVVHPYFQEVICPNVIIVEQKAC